MSATQTWSLAAAQQGLMATQMTTRTVVVASADGGLRERLRGRLTDLRWTVREAAGGAAATTEIEHGRPEALVVDGWLPDLEVGEWSEYMAVLYPGMEILRIDGGTGSKGAANGARSPRRNELLHAIREAQSDAPVNPAPAAFESIGSLPALKPAPRMAVNPIPELVGESVAMRELASLIQLVAPRSATVLIEGETGTGKEVVAKAIHRLSTRAAKPFVVLNCAAIPESLLEAELFGHTRGAFTGAVQARTGRIEAAHGGTLFLDEIGEMPLALQAKMLRFLECGELQRVGDNETMRVDVRVIAATHQPLEQRAEERTFRLDLYHRLAVFPLEVPPLRERLSDLPLLVEFFLQGMGADAPRKTVAAAALHQLMKHRWPGNVRELMHVLERGAILAGESSEIGAEEVRLRRLARA